MILGGTSAVGPSIEQELAAYAISGVVERVAGADRYSTAVAISQWTYPSGAPSVYLATSGTFVDALAGISVALKDNAPILLVGDDLTPIVRDEIERLGASNIVILGGPDAVSPTVGVGVWNILNDNDMPIWK